MMRVITILIVATYLASTSPAPPIPISHYRNDSEDFRRFISIKNEDGKLEFVDLKQDNITVSAAKLSDVKYYLYRKLDQKNGYLIKDGNVEQLKASGSPFDRKKMNYFIIHGWRNDYTSKVNTQLMPAILQTTDSNVFVVDWSKRTKLDYLYAKAAVAQIGTFVGTFIKTMQRTFGLDGGRFAMIGHSLGAHVAGCAGATAAGQLDHIVGLDPAGPLYNVLDISDRLDATDARYVQAIHTNGGLLGYVFALAHADYYPNGGEEQPGCGLDAVGSCAHARSYQYLAESITRGAVFTARQCTSYKAYKNGKCDNSPKSTMGQLNIDKSAKGKYYLDTNNKQPFGRG